MPVSKHHPVPFVHVFKDTRASAVSVVPTNQPGTKKNSSSPYLSALLSSRNPAAICTPGKRKALPSLSVRQPNAANAPQVGRNKKRSTSALFSSATTEANPTGQNRKRIKLVHGSKSTSKRSGKLAPTSLVSNKPLGSRKYEVAIEQFANAQSSPSRLRKSLNVLRDLQSKGIRPSIKSYHGLVFACMKNGQTGIARSILKRMMQLRVEHDRRGEDHKTYNSLIKLCMKLNDVDIAFGLINCMEQSKHVRITTGSIDILLKVSNTVGNKSHINAAVQLFGRLKKERGMKADRMLLDTMLHVLWSNHVFNGSINLIREAISIGMYRPFPLGTQSLQIWDLHGYRVMDACLLLAEAFDRAAALASQGVSRDIVIVTGKGINSPNAPVLRQKIPQFLREVIRLKVTRLRDNEGRLLVAGNALQEWASGSRYKQFQVSFGPNEVPKRSKRPFVNVSAGVVRAKRAKIHTETKEEKQKRRLLAWRAKFAAMQESGKLWL